MLGLDRMGGVGDQAQRHEHQHGRGGGHRDQVVQKCQQAKEHGKGNDQPDPDDITRMRAHAFVGRMPDIGGRRKRRAEQRAHHRAHTIGHLTGRHRIGVPRCLGAFDVVHGFDEVIDLHRHQNQKQLGVGKQVLDARDQVTEIGQRRIERDTLETDAGLAHAQCHHGAHDQRQQPGGHVERQPEPPDQAPQDDDHRRKADVGVLEHRGQGHCADEHQRDAAQRAQHPRTRCHTL